MKDELKAIVNTRTSFVFNDARTYIFVRKQGISTAEGLGGGNFATAYALFAFLNMISKVHYFLHKPSRFTTSDKIDSAKELRARLLENATPADKKIIKDYFHVPFLMQTNELNAFISFAKEIETKNIIIRLTHGSAEDDFKTIWNGFRNMLAHLATVQEGKGIMAYELKQHWPSSTRKASTIEDVLASLKAESKSFPAFFYQSSRSAWILNVDALVAVIPDILDVTIHCIEDSILADSDIERLIDFLAPK